MGFRNNAYATFWGIPESVFPTLTKGRISVSRKNKDSGEYETDFSGFVNFVGTAAANKAMSLKERDRIKLENVDVSTTYDKEKNKTYTNFKVFNFEMADGQVQTTANAELSSIVDDGDVDDSQLPY